MSQVVHYKWKLVPIKSNWKSLEEIIKSVIEKSKWKNYEIPDFSKYYNNNYIEYFNDVFSSSHIILKWKIYEIFLEEFEDNTDIFQAKEKDDWTIEMELKYYDWWCGRQEAITKAFDIEMELKWN